MKSHFVVREKIIANSSSLNTISFPSNTYYCYYMRRILIIPTAAFKTLHTVTNKPYVNEVTLTGQNLPLKCCQPLDFQCTFLKGLDLLMLKILGLLIKGLQSYQLSKLEVSRKVCLPAPATLEPIGPRSRSPGVKSFSKFVGWQLCSL